MRVIVNFQEHRKWHIHTMAEDGRTRLGPHIDVASKETMLRLFRYLGADDAAMAEVEQELRMWNRGGVHLDVPAEKLRLLRVSRSQAGGGRVNS